MKSDIGEKTFKKRARLREAGKLIWGIMVFIGLLGWIFWKWYALLISFGLAILVSSIYSYITARKIERETGLNINGQEMALKEYLYEKAERDYLDERMNEVIGGRKDNEDENGTPKIPITPAEIIRRMKDIPEIMKWSQNKHLVVEGPWFWGIHHVYVANDFKHILICLKEDLTTHIFIGIPTHAEEWRRYHKDAVLHFSKRYEEDDILQWKIYKDYVLYSGRMLPPNEPQEEPYWGEVMKVESWDGNFSDEWLVSTIKYHYEPDKDKIKE